MKGRTGCCIKQTKTMYAFIVTEDNSLETENSCRRECPTRHNSLTDFTFLKDSANIVNLIAISIKYLYPPLTPAVSQTVQSPAQS